MSLIPLSSFWKNAGSKNENPRNNCKNTAYSCRYKGRRTRFGIFELPAYAQVPRNPWKEYSDYPHNDEKNRDQCEQEHRSHLPIPLYRMFQLLDAEIEYKFHWLALFVSIPCCFHKPSRLR